MERYEDALEYLDIAKNGMEQLQFTEKLAQIYHLQACVAHILITKHPKQKNLVEKCALLREKSSQNYFNLQKKKILQPQILESKSYLTLDVDSLHKFL